MKRLLLLGLLLSASVSMMAQNSGQEGVKASGVSKQSPSFPGGQEALNRFLSANINYPSIAKEGEIQGRVMVRFNVMPNGSITNIEITESVHPSLDKEAIRVVKSMPRWIPGKDKYGKPIKVPFTMPVTFKLAKRLYSPNNHQLNRMVFFEKDKSTIDKSQSASIKKVAQYLISHPHDTLIIKGYTRIGLSPKQSQKLSETRAKVVKKELVNRYFFNANRIIANGMGATNEFDSQGDLNDVVLFYVKGENSSDIQENNSRQKRRLEADSRIEETIAQYDSIIPMPCFPDGPQAMSQFITDHLQYPESAKKDSIQGNVYVSFNVEREGTLTDLKVVRSISTELDYEACRIVKSMPKWIPVMKDGIPTTARYILPVKFSLGKTIPHDPTIVMPSFVGGKQALFEFLTKNIKYPVSAEEAKVQGRVIIGFIVDVDGSLTDIKVKKHIDPRLDKEALRIIKLMPRWIPGKLNGIPVSVEYTLPVTFRLQ